MPAKLTARLKSHFPSVLGLCVFGSLFGSLSAFCVGRWLVALRFLPFGFVLVCPGVPRARAPQAEKERRKGRATGTPESQRGQRGQKCNRRAFPICRGLVPGKGRPPERSRDWQPDAWLSLVWVAFGLVGPVPARGPQAKKERGKGKATGTPGAKEPES